MDQEAIQSRVDKLEVVWVDSLHSCDGVPGDFRPWLSNLSPSALYNCSLPHRKKMGFKAPEVKWMSIKRWITTSPFGIKLPDGVYLSIKRCERYHSDPEPRFEKIEFILLLFPHGNMWSQVESGVPITEEWLWSESGKEMMFEKLLKKDMINPVKGYLKAAYNYMLNNPDQIGIHLKRQKSIK
jgi:hypothetical protein